MCKPGYELCKIEMKIGLFYLRWADIDGRRVSWNCAMVRGKLGSSKQKKKRTNQRLCIKVLCKY